MPASRFLKIVQETGQIPVCSFYLPVSTSRNHPVVGGKMETRKENRNSNSVKSTLRPLKNGEIALLLTTDGLMCSKYVSQKRNEAIDNCQWYKMLLNFVL